MTPGELFLLETIKSFHGIKSTAEKAMDQISDQELHFQPDKDSNSVAIMVKHVSGNLISRFTDFLNSDGEKPDRQRDEEFIDHLESRNKLLERWNAGWKILFDELAQLRESDLTRTVFIRKEAHTVIRALNRQLVHYSYHTGQIVYLCKQIKSTDFNTLSIAKGKSVEFNETPPKNN